MKICQVRHMACVALATSDSEFCIVHRTYMDLRPTTPEEDEEQATEDDDDDD